MPDEEVVVLHRQMTWRRHPMNYLILLISIAICVTTLFATIRAVIILPQEIKKELADPNLSFLFIALSILFGVFIICALYMSTYSTLYVTRNLTTGKVEEQIITSAGMHVTSGILRAFYKWDKIKFFEMNRNVFTRQYQIYITMNERGRDCAFCVYIDGGFTRTESFELCKKVRQHCKPRPICEVETYLSDIEGPSNT